MPEQRLDRVEAVYFGAGAKEVQTSFFFNFSTKRAKLALTVVLWIVQQRQMPDLVRSILLLKVYTSFNSRLII